VPAEAPAIPSSEQLPKLVAFDLGEALLPRRDSLNSPEDYTLWELYVDTHVSAPIKRKGQDVNRFARFEWAS
jgi:hypothetical protein